MDRSLRVVQVSFHPDAQRRAPEHLLDAWPTMSCVAAALRRMNLDVVVVQTAHETRSLTRNDVAYWFIDDASRLRRPTIELVRSLAPDVIHVRGIHHLAAVATLAHTCDAPVLVQDHGSRIPTGWRASAWRWALRGVSGVTFTTRAQAEPFVHAGLLSPDTPVFEVLEGSSTFTPGDRAAARRATGMVGDPCLLWTGRLDDNKDPLTALAAVEIAAAELPELHLWMCYGKAPLLDAVRTRIDASPMLRERVTLLGTRPHEELEQRHRAADFYVQASHREAGGFSLLEAMACGTPPIVTDIPAARRITGDVGARVPVGDAAAFAQAIARLAREERDGRRAATRARFDSALSYDVVARELTVAYEALASVPA